MPSGLIPTILDGIEVGEFVHTYWQKQYLILDGKPGRFAELLPMAGLNRILTEHSLDTERLRLFRAGELVPPSQYRSMVQDVSGTEVSRVDAGRFAGELGRGALIALSGINDLYLPIDRLAKEFEYFFRESVNVNAYVGFAESKGFTTHWDDHEVFVLQVSGRKHWRIYGKTEASPMYRELLENERPPDRPVWEGVLEDGGVIYIPRGCWHDAESIGEPTVHLSVGIDCCLGVHLVSWLARELRASELFRRDLPRFGSGEERRSHARLLREELLARLDDDMIDRYLAAQDAAATARASVGLPASLGLGDGLIRWLPPRPVDVRIEVLGRFVEFEALGRQWILPRASEPLIRLLAAKRQLGSAEIRTKFARDVPALDHYLQTWLEQGLIEWIPV